MKGFFKTLLTSMLGVIIAFAIIAVLVVAIVSAIVSSQESPAEIKNNSTYILKLDREIHDREPADPFAAFNPMDLEGHWAMGLTEILTTIQRAKESEQIKGIYLNLSYIPAGMATVEEIRRALIGFKESGKFIVAYGEFFTQKAYYLATVADNLYLNPEGAAEFKGLNAQVLFLSETLKKLGIEPQVIRHGKFKGAVEPFIRKDLSEENKMQLSMLVNDIWDGMLDDIAASRGISKEQLIALSSDLTKTNLAEKLLSAKLIDGLKYEDEVYEEIKQLSGMPNKKEPQFAHYNQLKKCQPTARKRLAKDKIAVVYASGTVQGGKEGEGTVSSERIAQTIRQARADSAIKAIVFRVNSGGGSSLASEVIWRELWLAKQVKPVVASIGDMAASGGYYILCPADSILINRSSITGSIGVFGLMFNFQDFFNEKLGFQFDGVLTNPGADFPSLSRPLNASETKAIEQGVDKVYETFIKHVSEARNLSVSEVDSIGQGRVWSGAASVANGLTDNFGGLTEAIALAAKKANTDYYRVTNLPKQDEPLQLLMNKISEEASVKHTRKILNMLPHGKTVQALLNNKGVVALMPFVIDIQ
ncbi:MAG: signal peptide peptidase SppA [Bacteroidales bacterium]|nr:signal peptide peptidase SppA [Bacteroidales bacterium]